MLTQYLGELTLVEVEHLLSKYSVHDFVQQFPSEQRLIAMLFAACVQDAAWAFEVPSEQTELVLSRGKLGMYSKTIVKYFSEYVRVNKHTLTSIDISHNDLTEEYANMVSFVLCTYLIGEKLEKLNVAGCNANPAWVDNLRARLQCEVITQSA